MKDTILQIAQRAGFNQPQMYEIGRNEILVCSGMCPVSCHRKFKSYIQSAGYNLEDTKITGYGPGVQSAEYYVTD